MKSHAFAIDDADAFAPEEGLADNRRSRQFSR